MTSAGHVTFRPLGSHDLKETWTNKTSPTGRRLGCCGIRNDRSTFMGWVHNSTFQIFSWLWGIGKSRLVHFCSGVGVWPMDGTTALSSLASDSSPVEWLHYMIPYPLNDYTKVMSFKVPFNPKDWESRFQFYQKRNFLAGRPDQQWKCLPMEEWAPHHWRYSGWTECCGFGVLSKRTGIRLASRVLSNSWVIVWLVNAER